jgi:hypothetical protein
MNVKRKKKLCDIFCLVDKNQAIYSNFRVYLKWYMYKSNKEKRKQQLKKKIKKHSTNTFYIRKKKFAEES